VNESPEKIRRHRAIRTLLRNEAVANQQDLVRLLARNGFDVAQATLSRDLKEMRIHRVPGADGYRYQAADGAAGENGFGNGAAEARQLKSVAALEVTGIDSNEACVVVRTLTGRAQGVAVWLDGLGIDDLLATIAGDDTILVIPRSVKRTARLKGRIADSLDL
jgi:transcriptional regulator of arginine metabolism